MKFSDLITLVKSGYSYDQVKELLSLSVDMSPENEKETPVSGAGEDPAPDQPEEPEQPAAAEPVTNFEDLYKTAQSELSKIKKDLAELQSRNRQQDNSGEKTSDEDIVMNFLNS